MTVAQQMGLPAAAPIHTTSWLPHWMSTLWWVEQQVQDDVGPGAAVEQIPHDVQLVHRQPLDELAQPGDEPVGPAVLDDAAHDLAVIEVLVVVLKVGVEQLVQHITASRWQAERT